MIYFTTPDQKHILILEPENLDRLRAGNPIASPNSLVLIAFTPDINWFRDELLKVFNENSRVLTTEKFDELLREGLKRAEAKSDIPPGASIIAGGDPPPDPGMAPPAAEKP